MDSNHYMSLAEQFMSSRKENEQYRKNLYDKNLLNFQNTCGKTLLDMDADEIIAAILATTAHNYEQVMVYRLAISTFLNWCVEKHESIHPAGLRHLSLVTLDDIDLTDKVRDYYMTTPSRLLKGVNEERPIWDGYSEVPFLSLMWIGFMASEACSLPAEKVYLSSNAVKIQLNTGFFDDCDSSVYEVLDAYRRIKPGTIFYRKSFQAQVVNTPYFLKKAARLQDPNRDQPFNPINITRALCITDTMQGFKGSITDVRWSGALYRAYLDEKKGMGEEAALAHHIQMVIGRHHKDHKTRMLYTYRTYKKAFHLD